MKFIHCSDFHLDSALTSVLPQNKAKIRRLELLTAFSRIAEAAKKENAAVIIAGDLFDSNSASAKTRDYVTGIIAENRDVPFLLLPGNHDSDILLSEKPPENLHIFGESWTTYEFDGGNVRVTGSTKPDRQPPEIDAGKLNIVVMHGADGTDFSLRDLKDKGIDYIALGHYHSYAKESLDRRGVFCYSGCPEGRGFDEEGEKGYVTITAENGAVTSEFVPFAKRCVRIVKADMSDATDLTSQKSVFDGALKDIGGESIVRVVITGTYENGRQKQYDTLTDLNLDRFFHLETEDLSVLKTEAADYINDISLRGEFIRLVYESVTDEKRRGDIIECGLRALQKEKDI